jgi:uncharacterized cupredoxin-like copper-binding protein
LRRRVSDVGFLVGIGVVAVAIGALAIAYGPDESVAAMGMGSNQSASELAVPDRTEMITIGDQFQFSPDAVTVNKGDTVAFVITNNADVEHEFVIGDEKVQAQHEQQMAAGSESMNDMGATPYAVDIPAHSTATLVYTFDQTGNLIMGCHVPGHYAGGMRGTITVQSN